MQEQTASYACCSPCLEEAFHHFFAQWPGRLSPPALHASAEQDDQKDYSLIAWIDTPGLSTSRARYKKRGHSNDVPVLLR